MTGVSISNSITRGVSLSRALMLWLIVTLALPFGGLASTQSKLAGQPAGNFSTGEQTTEAVSGAVRMAGTETVRLTAQTHTNFDDDTPLGFSTVAALFASEFTDATPSVTQTVLRPSAHARVFSARAPPARA